MLSSAQTCTALNIDSTLAHRILAKWLRQVAPARVPTPTLGSPLTASVVWVAERSTNWGRGNRPSQAQRHRLTKPIHKFESQHSSRCRTASGFFFRTTFPTSVVAHVPTQSGAVRSRAKSDNKIGFLDGRVQTK